MEETLIKILASAGGTGIVALIFYFIFRGQTAQIKSTTESHAEQMKALLASQEAERAEWRRSNDNSQAILINALRGVEKAVNDMNTTTVILSTKIDGVECVNYKSAGLRR